MTESPRDPWGERLSRRLGLWSAVAVLVGSTIGSGIFRTPASVAQRIDDVPLFLLAWVVGGVVAVCGALTYAELAAAFPRSGGMYVFLREAFGPLTAFLFGWAELLIIRPGAYGAIGITASAYSLRTVGLDPAAPVLGLPVRGDQALGAGFIILVAAVNYFGIKRGAVIQNLSTAFKVGALAALIVLGFLLGDGLGAGPMLDQRAAVAASPFLLAMVSILWAYDGWADLAFVGGEVKDPQRTLPRALVIGTSIVVVLYLGANLVYLYLIPITEMQQAELVAADVASLLIGPAGIVAISAAVAVSTFGTLNGSMMTAPRIFFAMAEDGLFPKAIARVDERTGAPTAAILLAAVLGVIFVLIKTFTELADQFVIGIWPFYALAVAAVFVLRRTRPDLPRPYRTAGYPVVPLLFLAGSLFLLGNYLVSEPKAFVVDVVVILSGVPVYYGWKRWAVRR
ncbi:MAG: amino acid permease [Gemmatimonadetes bacterium]|nr:amino acid permease [Gemmatimonadota bacterium]MBK6780366.1 amino acid permease [Gemmatimonadota bacterium]MBK7351109.1 amino acid permease [Gemmatimonadota bacterium]MBK7715086.1 amino acid permease [Gemmatimonadota bacterium]MBK7786269.1 amino acid permease [Gemmatimonadota bacterium]